MKKANLLLYPILFLGFSVLNGQNTFTNPDIESILLGDYNPSDFYDDLTYSAKNEVKSSIMNDVSPSRLYSYLQEMNEFKTRHTSSDTLGPLGIGAARDYALAKFQSFAENSSSPLIPSFFQFTENVCGMGRHKNICAVQPGVEIDDPSIIIVMAHFDSRCADVCDVECDSPGMEDNGSGSALVFELARIMSQYKYKHTILYVLTVGEEQGLFGADAMARYCTQKGIEVKAVFNNDTVGGIICGETSSVPSCPGEGHIDSTQVRLFSNAIRSRQLSRWIKEQYKEELRDEVDVSMLLTIMSLEDRQGRGGDHIPFRERGFRAMRFTTANEHGNANTSDPNYKDRQHTSDDILGVDTDNDGALDSFFVDFNYLARNAVINGISASFAANGPKLVNFEGFLTEDSILINILDDNDYLHYKIYSRSTRQDFDTSYVVSGQKSKFIVRNPGSNFAQFISVASVDENGIESLLSDENFVNMVLSDGISVEIPIPEQKVATLFQNRPNPFDEATSIGYILHKAIGAGKIEIVIRDMKGILIKRLAAPKVLGVNEVVYNHGFNKEGAFIYTLEINGVPVESKTMVFAY
ncbi:MAG: M28 family peptidase [Bacteroidota bacterium]